MKKTLVFHCYLKENSDLSYLKVHFYFLKKYFRIFDNLVFVFSMDDLSNVDLKKFVFEKLCCHLQENVTIKFIKNNKEFGEVETFLSEILCNNNINGLVFFCHSKGASFFNENTFLWVSCMYYYNLNFMYDVINKLRNNVFYGTLLHYSDGDFLFNKNCVWYPGTFYWLNIDNFRKYLNDNGLTINGIFENCDKRFFAEKLPGELFTKDDLQRFNNVDFNAKTVNLYNSFDGIIEKLGFYDEFYAEYNNMLRYNL